MAPSRSVLVGIPAVLTAIPPGRGLGSTMATRFPKYAAWAAPFSPAGPAPITTRSYFDRHVRRLAHQGWLPLWPDIGRAPGTPGSSNSVAAHARREGADVNDRLPAVVRDLVLDALRDVQRLPGTDLHVSVAHAHVALALEHVHDLLRGGVPVLGIGLARQDVHEPEALLAARGQLVVGDPLDPSPLVSDRLDVLGLGDDALKHVRTSL